MDSSLRCAAFRTTRAPASKLSSSREAKVRWERKNTGSEGVLTGFSGKIDR